VPGLIKRGTRDGREITHLAVSEAVAAEADLDWPRVSAANGFAVTPSGFAAFSAPTGSRPSCLIC
jgi:hypothetical protein